MLETICLLSISVSAVCMDLRKQRIPNRLMLVGLFMGFLLQVFHYGELGILVFLGGVLTPAAVLGIIYYFRMMGAGDIKLFAVLGGMLGVTGGMYCMAFSFLWGALIALVLMIRRENLWERLGYFLNYVRSYAETGMWKPYKEAKETASHMYFSVPILLGVLLRIGGVY